MAGEVRGLAMALLLGLMVMAPTETMQLNVDHPLHGLVQRVNYNYGPFLVLLMSGNRDMNILMDSGYFHPNPAFPSITIAGREITFGFFKGAATILTFHGQPSAATGATVQMLIDTFRVRGIIAYGTSGAVGRQLEIGDVVVPDLVGFAGVWQWQPYQSAMVKDKTSLPTLNFGDFNVPEAGENRLGSIQYQTVTAYTPTKSKKKTFWFTVDSDWINVASNMKQINLKKPMNGTVKVIHGTKLASSDIYVSNQAYAEFLSDNLDVAVVDTASAPVVQTAKANGVAHIIFRGASNKPGEKAENEDINAAARNVLEVVAEFVELITPMPSSVSVGTY